MRFEQATEADVEAFIALERIAGDPKTYGPILDIEAAREEIRSNTLYFITIGAVVVGTAAYRKGRDGSIYISNVAVDPAYRRRGIARKAMLFILDKNKGAHRFDLVTHPENEGALRLYMSLGFGVESRQENYFGDGEPRLVLAKDG